MRCRFPVKEEGKGSSGREDDICKGTVSCFEKNGESLVDFWPECTSICKVGGDR